MNRRTFLAIASTATLTSIAGCSGDGGPSDETDPASENETDDPKTSDVDQQHHGGSTTDEPIFEMEGSADLPDPLTLDVSEVQERGQTLGDDTRAAPISLDVTVRNEGEDPRTVEFPGFVPMPEHRTTVQDEDRDGELLLVPTYGAEDLESDVTTVSPEVTETDLYYAVEQPVEVPDATTLTIEPGAAVGGKHTLLLPAEGESDGDSQYQQPSPGSYEFGSQLPVEGPDGDGAEPADAWLELTVFYEVV